MRFHIIFEDKLFISLPFWKKIFQQFSYKTLMLEKNYF